MVIPRVASTGANVVPPSKFKSNQDQTLQKVSSFTPNVFDTLVGLTLVSLDLATVWVCLTGQLSTDVLIVLGGVVVGTNCIGHTLVFNSQVFSSNNDEKCWEHAEQAFGENGLV